MLTAIQPTISTITMPPITWLFNELAGITPSSGISWSNCAVDLLNCWLKSLKDIAISNYGFCFPQQIFNISSYKYLPRKKRKFLSANKKRFKSMEKVASNHGDPGRQRSCTLRRSSSSLYHNPKGGFIVFGGVSIGFASHKTTAQKSRKYQIST